MPNPGSHKSGEFYWCVGSPESEDGEIYVYGDRVEVNKVGVLIIVGREERPNLILAPGRWTFCFPASVMDGSACTVEHWKGKIVE